MSKTPDARTEETPSTANNCDSPPSQSCDCDAQQGALIAADIDTNHGIQIDVDALGFNVADISVDLSGLDGLLSDLLC